MSVEGNENKNQLDNQCETRIIQFLYLNIRIYRRKLNLV